MSYKFLDIAATPSVRQAQAANGSLGMWSSLGGERDFDRLSSAEAAFIAARDSFYMATLSENDWPYIQHRGGPPGFLQVLDERTLACADFRGNRQYISVGNLAANDRASLILVDYPARRRLKILAHAEVSTDPDVIARVAVPGYRAKVERALVFRLEAFDWNCPQHITPRYTIVEIEAGIAAMQAKIAELEAENKLLKARTVS